MSGLFPAMAAVALLVRVGQWLIAIGTARSKNAASALARGLLDVCIAIVAFWAVGAAIVMGNSNSFLSFDTRWLLGFDTSSAAEHLLRLLPLILIPSAVATAATAERSRLLVPVVMSFILAVLVVPIAGHWTGLFGSIGWLINLGYRDESGAAAIHLAGATAAIVAARMVGPRQGKYHADGSASIIPGHNVPLIAIGAALMLVGWMPCTALLLTQPGDPFTIAPATTTMARNALLAAAAGTLAATTLSARQFGKADVMLMLGGLLAGLVSSSAAGGHAPGWAALVVGAISGALVSTMTTTLDLRLRIDDVGGLIVPHLTGAVVGLLGAAALVHGSVLVRVRALGVQLTGIVAITILTCVLVWVTLLILRATVGLRSRDADEFDGLDLADHDVNAHPDFQQTMIKSYHLREA